MPGRKSSKQKEELCCRMDGNSLKTAFKNKDRMAIVDPGSEMKERMPKVTQGQTFYAVAAEKTEHFYIAHQNHTVKILSLQQWKLLEIRIR